MKEIDLTGGPTLRDGVDRDAGHKVLSPGEGRRVPHQWSPAPPGQGSRQQTCKECGQRVTVVGKDSVCPGRHSSAVTETINDYDPFTG